jgi:4'-phosphopantetheinyl transferase
MPLHEIIKTTFSNQSSAEVLVWHITESFDALIENNFLKPESSTRLNQMKSKMHQRAFLSIRQLLKHKNLSDNDLFYGLSGKPFLKNGQHISISHSHEFAAIAISNQNIGIDLEQNREKIIKIAPKFCEFENTFLNASASEYVQKLTLIWAAKEAVFKIENLPGISFKNHISVSKIDFSTKKISTVLNFNQKNSLYEMHFESIENFSVVFGIKIQE